MDIKSKIEKLLESKLASTDCFLVDIKASPQGRIQVFIDCDSGVTIDRCGEISRFLESYLDEDKSIPEKYNLEVSSPGLDQPLKLKRQYAKNVGREIEVLLTDGTLKQGILLFADNENITLEETRKKETVQTQIPFIDIKKTKITIKI